MNYAKLEKNICDTVKEGQIKIGYSDNPVRLYYPIESIAELLEMDMQGAMDTAAEQEMTRTLLEFVTVCSPRLGKVEISNKGERFCFLIPKEGTKYINEIYTDNPFLRRFIQNITKPGCTLKDILNVFYEFSKDIYIENDKDLGDVIYFKDEKIDEYVYCLKFDEFGATYHRFTRLDHKRLLG